MVTLENPHLHSLPTVPHLKWHQREGGLLGGVSPLPYLLPATVFSRGPCWGPSASLLRGAVHHIGTPHSATLPPKEARGGPASPPVQPLPRGRSGAAGGRGGPRGPSTRPACGTALLPSSGSEAQAPIWEEATASLSPTHRSAWWWAHARPAYLPAIAAGSPVTCLLPCPCQAATHSPPGTGLWDRARSLYLWATPGLHKDTGAGGSISGPHRGTACHST